MAKKKLQLAMDELRVQDKKLVEALDAIEEFEAEAAPVKEKRAEASRPYNVALKGLSDQYDVPQLHTTVADRETVIVEKLKDRLFDGAQIRVGGYVITVKQIDTIEEVKHGKGWRLAKPLRVDADGEGDAEE